MNIKNCWKAGRKGTRDAWSAGGGKQKKKQKDGGKAMTVTMTPEGSIKIPSSIVKMAFYRLKYGQSPRPTGAEIPAANDTSSRG
jgi:hypothetical protein